MDLTLAVGETGEIIEWVDIDPEAFTGTVNTPSIHPSIHTSIHASVHINNHNIQVLKVLQVFAFTPFREWWVGHCPSSSQENDQQSVFPRWPGVSGDLVQSGHPKEAAVLHHQCYPALFPYLISGRTGLLPTCTRSVRSMLFLFHY